MANEFEATGLVKLGLLPHEADYVMKEVRPAQLASNDAESFLNDRKASREGRISKNQSVNESLNELKGLERRASILRELAALAIDETVPPVGYPDPTYPTVTFGSRIVIASESSEDPWDDVYELGTHDIPGIDTGLDYTTISPEQAIGAALLNKAKDEIAEWKLTDGRITTVRIVAIDQNSQRMRYEANS